MQVNSSLPLASDRHELSDMIEPLEVITSMIDLRIQLADIEQQIQALRPAFFAACLALNMEKISLERAVITRKLTPGRWTYSDDILEQESLLRCLRKQFQQNHEPSSGREVSWAIKLLLMTT
jgi:hypothetical protein